MRFSKLLRVLALVLVVLPAAGCVDEKELARMDPLDTAKILESAPIRSAIATTAAHGKTLCSAMVVLLALLCWYRAHQGAATWLQLMLEFLYGIVIAVYVTQTIGTSAGVGEFLFETGRDIGKELRWVELEARTPVFSDPLEASVKVKSKGILYRLLDEWKDGKFAAGSVQDAFVNFVLKPEVSLLINVNTMCSYVVRGVLGISYAWLIAFGQMTLSLIAWTAILPQTRFVFYGWFKAYLGVCLWPIFFGMVERCNNATLRLVETDVQGYAGTALMEKFVFSQLELMILTLVIVGMYFMVPVISRRLVNGTAESIKVGIAG